MTSNIEWASVSEDEPAEQAVLFAPAELSDTYGSENNDYALQIGSCIIEASLDAWIVFATALLDQAHAAKAEANGDSAPEETKEEPAS